MGALAVVGAVIAGYLTFQSVVTGTAPLGCGSGSGCEEVLASKWSKWLGIPVSGLATFVYVVVLGALFVVRGGREAEAGRLRAGWFILVVSATAIVGAGVWFTAIQLFSLRAVCPYCIADHLCGVALAALIFWSAPIRSGAFGQPLLQGLATAVAITVGVAGTGTIALTQYNTAAVVHRVDLPTDRDFDIGSGVERRIGVLNGKLHLAPHDEGIDVGKIDAGKRGSDGAPAIIVIMYDYSCPHCRHTHGLLSEFKEDHRDRVAVIGLPLPLNRECNPHAPEDMPERFDHSCELARLALAVKLTDPRQFATFDQWLFEPEMPRQPVEARDEAARLVGEQPLETTLGDQRVEAILERNIAAYKDSGADRVPVVFAVGVAPTVGKIEDEAILTEIFEQTTKSRLATAAQRF